MLSRFLKRPSILHLFKTLILPNNTHYTPHPNISLFTPRFPLQISHFKLLSSSNRNNNNGRKKNTNNASSNNKNGGDSHDPKSWMLNDDDEEEDDIFSFDKEEPIEKSKRRDVVESGTPNKWRLDSNDNEEEEDVFKFDDEEPIEGVNWREEGEERKMDGGKGKGEGEVEDDPFAGFTSGGVDGVGVGSGEGGKEDRFKPWSGFGGDEEGKEEEEEVFGGIEEGIEPIGVKSEVAIEGKEGLSEELKKEKKALEAKLKSINLKIIFLSY